MTALILEGKVQGSEQWHANNINGQVVHTKPPYPGVGRCSVQLIPCPFPVSANDVSMSPVVAPGRDAMLMEFEEDSADFFFVQGSGEGVGSFPVVQWASSVVGSYVPGSPLGEGDEADVKPSHVGVCDVVPPLVVWEELFVASEDYFAHGGGGTDSEKVPVDVVSLPAISSDGSGGGDGVEVSGVAVESSHQSGEGHEGDIVEEAIVGFVSFVVLGGGGCVVVLGVLAVLGIVFGWG